MKAFLPVLIGPLVLSTWLATARANIDFTLGTRRGAPESDSRYFTDGDNHIYLRIPHDWKAIGGAGKLDLLPESSGSEVEITQVGGAQALPLDPAGLEALRKTVRSSLPDGAKDVRATGEINDLLPVFGWKSFEATFDYDFFGEQMRRSVLFINMLPGRVIRVRVTAHTSDFEAVHEKMRKMMFGWFEPKRDLTPEGARKYESGEVTGS